MTVISGRADAGATREFLARQAGPVGLPERTLGPWAVSSLGWGTNSGELRNIVDLKVESAVADVLAGGINLLDTSPAYRHRRSQAALGRALPRLLGPGRFRREELVITSHCGFVALNRKEEDLGEYFRRHVLPDSGLEEADFVAEAWSMHPRWIRAQLALSCTLLGVGHIDVLYLDAPELALSTEGMQRWQALLLTAFGELEQLVDEGAIGAWGLASLQGWFPEGSRRAPLELAPLLDLARRAGRGRTRLAVVQAPFNLGNLAFLNTGEDGADSLQKQVLTSGLAFTGMLSLGQGQLCQGLPDYLRPLMPGCTTDAQRALQFARSTPGVTAALVGMKTREHILENVALAGLPAMSDTDWHSLFS
jgi:aryl-alcohol dehydrogenase-like predicted oxidoreductase